MIIGIDPSFSSSGVALASDDYSILKTYKICHGGSCYTSIVDNHDSCDKIWCDILSILDSYQDLKVIIEYPVFASRSGAYLAVLNGYLAAKLRSHPNVVSITWIPPTACNSFTRNSSHSKTYLVNYCLDKQWISKRISHDECTAVIFVKLFEAISRREYKNRSFTWYK